ncbi:MAG: hypothetical protein LCI00_15590 [Chloroflexi bacterium]|nr:hypothetical protein [Chloroflexota bacterium]
MPRRVYSPDEKANALETLNRFHQDIAATSLKTGIPRRTLYTWRMEQWDQQRQRRRTLPPSPPKELQKFETLTEFFEHIRTQMMHVFGRLAGDLSHLPPYLQRDHESARLTTIDVIMKLTKLIGPPEQEVIEYINEYPDLYPELATAPKPKPQPIVIHTHRTPDGLPPPGYKDPAPTTT